MNLSQDSFPLEMAKPRQSKAHEGLCRAVFI